MRDFSRSHKYCPFLGSLGSEIEKKSEKKKGKVTGSNKKPEIFLLEEFYRLSRSQLLFPGKLTLHRLFLMQLVGKLGVIEGRVLELEKNLSMRK